MACVTSIAGFISDLRQHGLLDEPRIRELTEKLEGSGASATPSKLAAALVKAGRLTEFQAKYLLAGKASLLRLGKYRMLDELGAGGNGSVYLAENTLLRRTVAIKILPAQQSKDQVALARFIREARAVAALDHPNIVRAYDVDLDGERCFIVMEYVRGITLHDLVQKEGPLDPVRAAECAAQAGEGLEHIHQAGLVHRDIKPSNLVLVDTGIVKLLDLGLARFSHDTADKLTQNYEEHAVLGTVDFMAPEQALSSHDVDIRADIYGLGATLYYLLSGQAPFQGMNVTQKLVFVQTRDPAPLLSLRPDTPLSLATIVDRMMKKNPEDRFSSPKECVTALRSWMQIDGRNSTSSRATGGAAIVARPTGPARAEPTHVDHRNHGADHQTVRTNRNRADTVVADPTVRTIARRPQPQSAVVAAEIVEEEPELAVDRGRRRPKRLPPPAAPARRRRAPHGLSQAAIAGIGVGAIAVIALAVLMFSGKRAAAKPEKTAVAMAQAVLPPAVVGSDLPPPPAPPQPDRRGREYEASFGGNSSQSDAYAPVDPNRRFRHLSLDGVATISSLTPMFFGRDDHECLVLSGWGPRTFRGIPFEFIDPNDSRKRNVILLYGPQGQAPPKMPRSVAIPCEMSVKSIHLLSGIAGWGFPATSDVHVCMKLRVHVKAGGSEDYEFQNGVHFADYIRRTDVRGSEYAFNARGAQVRYLQIQRPKADEVERLEFIKGESPTAPVILAVTVELP